MGHREALIAGAKRCLYERGYARTTARDIVAASGTNLASIGYHFGSKEALLNAAMIEAIEEWSSEIAIALAADTEAAPGSVEQFKAIWTRVIESFTTHRQLWLATLEIMIQAEHLPEVRAYLADAVEQGRTGLASLFQPEAVVGDAQTARVVGAFYQALLSGVFIQWLIDPQHAPSSDDLAEALGVIVDNVEASP